MEPTTFRLVALPHPTASSRVRRQKDNMKRTFKKYDGSVEGFIWLRTDNTSGSFEQRNELPGSIKCGELSLIC
jgi:hypothetical protein